MSTRQLVTVWAQSLSSQRRAALLKQLDQAEAEAARLRRNTAHLIRAVAKQSAC